MCELLAIAKQCVSWIISSQLTYHAHHIWHIKSNLKNLEASSITKVTIYETENGKKKKEKRKKKKSMMAKTEETVKKEG